MKAKGFRDACREVRKLGGKLTWLPDTAEYRVWFRHTSGYYTEDLTDALQTARMIALELTR